MITLNINGKTQHVDVEADMPLLWVLRDELALTGTKYGCGIALCGSCTVHVDGAAARSCVTPVGQVAGKRITTIEALAQGERLHPVQQAFVDQGAFQCGYCTSAMVLLTTALLAHHPRPDRATITEWISSNVCRCTGYAQIIAAVEQAAARIADGDGT